jgi:hypothetical protein
MRSLFILWPGELGENLEMGKSKGENVSEKGIKRRFKKRNGRSKINAKAGNKAVKMREE